MFCVVDTKLSLLSELQAVKLLTVLMLRKLDLNINYV